MIDIIAAILKRPMVEIAEIAGITITVVTALGISVYLILKGIASLHIKKIGVSGIECTPETRRSIFRRKRSK